MCATLRMTGQMSKKGATRRLRQHTCIAPAKCSKIGLWSGPSGLGGCVPGWPPEAPKLDPPHRPSPDPTEPENPKNRGQKTGQFLGPENGPKNGSVFRTFIKIPCSEAEKRTHFQVHFLDLKTVPFFGRGFSISVYRAPQNRDRKRVHFSSLADPPGAAALPPSHRAPPLPIPSPPISQSTPHLSKKPSF